MTMTKKRHWLLSIYIVLSIVMLSIGFILFGHILGDPRFMLMKKFPDVPKWVYYAIRFNFLFHIMSLVALFHWKKWGFYGAATACIISVILNITLSGKVTENLSGLLSIVILFCVLQIGGERKGWTQLE
ncbi:hypothetical protein F6V25_14590 [Oryzomonas japonica]|uniref:Uncharacterized protein n=1 Tax=Oryzomonas japonica TaxID=2603858 RepID=A0A7J4ZN86_9BACT|nr:hypothetical protein [Oryzomonas japonica]KAB0664032.1 hypothetical protein F6V25_14590 [Oryzomonas japonica]